MGVAVSLVLTKWYNLHRLILRLKFGITSISGLGKTLDIVRIATIMVILAQVLEVDLGDIAVSSGDFYQFLMKMDIISGI